MDKIFRSITLALMGLIVILMLSAGHLGTAPPRKPLNKNLTPEWYLVSRVTNQMSTAYVEPPGAPVSASARSYFLGGVAVHPKIPGGDQRDPIIPFGTVIRLSKPKSIFIQGRRINSFVVTDTGDADWGLWPNYPYWVDFYFGSSNYWNTLAASKYGNKPIDYYWYERIE
jgi:hypothetical protein